MYLLDTSTLELHYFIGKKNIPPYAILSHRWEDEEVTFKDLGDGKGPSLRGWSKIQQCCAQAVDDGLSYAWVDTCCIDKSSSAELSEAINSMFRWYRDSEICYAYLSDVDIPEDGDGDILEDSDGDKLARSKWFTRGWTLQELIAPRNLVFFDRLWTWIGIRDHFRDVIEKVTGIDGDEDFYQNRHYRSASIAERMSWASRRETTREEDMAYCLMGLFDVNMPLLYGEGGKQAFYRLQLEILKRSDDDSILYWNQECFSSNAKRTEVGPRIDSFAPYQVSPFASSPELFRYSSKVQRGSGYLGRDDYSITNKGLHINLTSTLIFDLKEKWISLMVTPLDCRVYSNGDSPLDTVMYLVNFSGNRSKVEWYRWGPIHPADYDFNDDDRRIYIRDWPYTDTQPISQDAVLGNDIEQMMQTPKFQEMFKPLCDYLDSCP